MIPTTPLALAAHHAAFLHTLYTDSRPPTLTELESAQNVVTHMSLGGLSIEEAFALSNLSSVSFPQEEPTVVVHQEDLKKRVPYIVPGTGLTIDKTLSLGEGGHAQVYAGTLDSRPVAIKCARAFNIHSNSIPLDHTDLHEDLIRSRFTHPAVDILDLWHTWDHPCLVPLLGIGVVDGVGEPVVVMERMEVSVAEVLRGRRVIAVGRREKWVTETCEGMVYLHSQNPPVVHLDLRPENLFLDYDGHVRIGDFGLSKQLCEKPDANQPRGTPCGPAHYAPPESFVTEEEYEPTLAHDVYSFGMTAFEILFLERPFDLFSGKVAVVTGGGSGICLGMATALARHGCSVALVGRTKEKLDSAAEQIRAVAGKGVVVLALSTDVRNKEQLDKAVLETVEKCARIDYLICGAAGNFLCDAESLSTNAFQTVIDIDLVGTFNAAKAVLPFLKKTKGAILNVSATLQYKGTPMMAHACAAKAGVDALTKVLALEWGKYGIRVNAIAPGPIEDTVGMSKLTPDGMRDSYLDAIPLKRFGKIRDIEFATLYLLSEAAALVTGTIHVVDGGEWLAGPMSVALERAQADAAAKREAYNASKKAASKL
ncbi:hypothetical protein HDU98_001639 [Podochytrium sp. JEL0797]|nr:hypothetical protein HDU98_001639 [Podochytrium sp. JEL0797]